MIEELKLYLTHHQKKHIFDSKRVNTAILLPIFYKEGQYHVLFLQRSETVNDHKGQISFPGGHFDDIDRTLRNTAIRECTEEIGVPADCIDILGEIDDAITLTSYYVISPFIGRLPYPASFTLQEKEVAGVFDAPVRELMNPAILETSTAILDGEQVETYSYHYQDKVIWGATARILHDFLQIIAQLDYPSCH